MKRLVFKIIVAVISLFPLLALADNGPGELVFMRQGTIQTSDSIIFWCQTKTEKSSVVWMPRLVLVAPTYSWDETRRMRLTKPGEVETIKIEVPLNKFNKDIVYKWYFEPLVRNGIGFASTERIFRISNNIVPINNIKVIGANIYVNGYEYEVFYLFNADNGNLLCFAVAQGFPPIAEFDLSRWDGVAERFYVADETGKISKVFSINFSSVNNRVEENKKISLQNYPNPFNSATTIKFSLTKTAFVILSIYNVRGQRVTVLAKGDLFAGQHTIRWRANSFPSGQYFLVLQIGDKKLTRRMLLIK